MAVNENVDVFMARSGSLHQSRVQEVANFWEVLDEVYVWAIRQDDVLADKRTVGFRSQSRNVTPITTM